MLVDTEVYENLGIWKYQTENSINLLYNKKKNHENAEKSVYIKTIKHFDLVDKVRQGEVSKI